MNRPLHAGTLIATFLGLALPACGPACARGPDAVAGGEEGREEAALLELLAAETEIATKTKMNADFVPGTVTVLRGDDLEALGAETVWDALALVPGVQAVRDENATPTLVVRGLSAPFNQGNVKILVNGTDLSRPEGGVNGSVLYLPIELVERIEVIRGPGSVLYGDFALLGVVNIVTRSGANRAYLRADSDRARSGGGHLSWPRRGAEDGEGDRSGGTAVALDVSGWSSDDAPFPAPDRADEARLFTHLAASRGGFGLAVQTVYRRVDPAAGGQRIYHDKTVGVEARYDRELRPGLETTVRLGYLSTDVAGGFTTFDSDLSRADATVRWAASERHHLIVGADFAPSTIHRAVETPPPPPNPPPGAPPPRPITAEDADREVLGLTVQDRFSITDALEVTAGARYDDQSDVGVRWTPRLSLVWRLSEHHILKGQYAEGFRPPTFFELRALGPNGSGGINEDLDFEANATTEVSYVYRRPAATGRLTVFDAELNRAYTLDRSTGRFDNSRRGSARGAEIEWEQHFGGFLTLLANLSTVDTEDSQGLAGGSPGASDWLGNLALLYRPLPGLRLGARWRHVGDRVGPGDDGYDTVDLTVTCDDLGARGLGLRAGVDDLFDDGIRDPVNRGAFAGTATFPGRRLWVQLSWKG